MRSLSATLNGFITRTHANSRTLSPTQAQRLLGNQWAEIAKQLDKRCDGSYRHIALINGRAKRAEVYPGKLRMHGLVNKMKNDMRLSLGEIGCVTHCDEDMSKRNIDQVFWDALSGKELREGLEGGKAARNGRRSSCGSVDYNVLSVLPVPAPDDNHRWPQTQGLPCILEREMQASVSWHKRN